MEVYSIGVAAGVGLVGRWSSVGVDLGGKEAVGKYKDSGEDVV